MPRLRGRDALSTGPILGVRRTTPALAPSYRNCAHGTTILRRPNLDGVRKNPETNDATPTTGPSTPREKCVSNYLGAASPTSEPPKSAYSPRVHPPARPPAGVPGAALARFVGFDRYLRAPRQGFGLRPRLRPARRAVPRATSAVWSKTGRRPILPLAAPIKIGPSVSWTVPYVQPTGKMRNSRCASAELAISMFSHATSLLPTSPAARRSTELKWPLGWAQKFERKSKVRSTLLPIALSFDFYRSRAHKRRPFPRRRSSARKLTLKVTWKTYRNLFYLKGHAIMTRGVRGISVGYPLRYPLRGVVYPLGLKILLTRAVFFATRALMLEVLRHPQKG